MKACSLGPRLGAVNPKNLALSLAAGGSIAQAGISTAGKWGTALIFVAVASVTVLIPVVFGCVLIGQSIQTLST